MQKRYCAFCGKERHEVFYLVEAPANVNICDDCVVVAADIVQAARGRVARGEAVDRPHRSLSDMRHDAQTGAIKDMKFEGMPTTPCGYDLKRLLRIAQRINDKFDHHPDHVTFEGSMNDAEEFRKIVNDVWHRWDFGL